MSAPEVQPVAADVSEGAGLSQIERVTNIFSAPSKTFTDIKRGNRSWWMPFLITCLFGAFLWGAVNKQVTWKTVAENNDRAAPEFAKRMIEQMPPEQKAAREQKAPISQAITWGLAPLGLLIINLISAGVLLATVNFGFGGKANYKSILAVLLYSGLVVWPIKLFLGGVALFAGAAPESFLPANPAGTNIAYFLNQQETAPALYALAGDFDVLAIWSMVITAIGISIVAGTKRSTGYMVVFGWWFVIILLQVGISAIF